MSETGTPTGSTKVGCAIASQARSGMALHRQGKLADAERCYGEMLQRQPDHFDALHLLGVIARQTRRTERGSSTDQEGYRAQTTGRRSSGNRQCAAGPEASRGSAGELRQGDRAKARTSRAHNNRGNALLDLKRPAEALASYHKAIALKRDYAEAHYNRGNALKDLERPAEALASYNRAIALKPDHAQAYSNRGAALMDLKRSQKHWQAMRRQSR